MEQDRYACKLCKKRFPCGRSLGGHMRSHVMNTKKISSLRYGGSNSLMDPNHTNNNSQFADSSEDNMLVRCDECGKGFDSWKALFGHMKLHSERISSTNVEDNDSLITQSDDEPVVPSQKKRSLTKMKRYTTNDATSSSEISEIEQEQEDVAISLMMLSRDESNWGGSGVNSLDESCDDFSGLLGSSNLGIAKIDVKNFIDNNVEKFKKLRNGLESAGFDASKNPRIGFLGKEKKFKKVDEEFEFEQRLHKKIEFCGADELGRKNQDLFDPKMGLDYSSKFGYGTLDSQEKKNKFQCGTCSKIFHSYQALGGHRASHKKQKICSDSSKINVSKNNNNITTQFSQYKNNPVDKMNVKPKNRLHECPICFRVFSSGQALGGHKRSHLIVQKAEPIQENLREFLDLNMPAPSEEESSNSHGEFNPWMSNHCSRNHEEALINLHPC